MIRLLFLLGFSVLSLMVRSQSSQGEDRDVWTLLPEDVLVHTDKDFYIGGEVIWYKLYVVSKTDHRLQSLSKTAYVELSGKEGASVFKTRTELQDGTGSGSFLLSDSIPSGVYELRVYTNWMKNHPGSVFRKNISIVNTQRMFDTSAFSIVQSDEDIELMQPFGQVSGSGHDAFQDVHPDQSPVRLILDKKEYLQRRQVTLKLHSTADHGGIDNLSVAVFKLNSLTRPAAIGKYATPGKINLVTPDEGLRFIPEMNGFVVSVKAVNHTDGKPAAAVPVIVSLTGKLTDVKFGETDEKGIAYFNFKNTYGDVQFFLGALPEYSGQVDLQLLPGFLQFHQTAPARGVIFQKDLDALEEMHHNLMVNRAFNSIAFPGDRFFPENQDSISFYGKPYKTYLLDDYKRFVTMEEVLREYVMEANVRIKKDGYSIPVFSTQNFKLSSYLLIDKMTNTHGSLILIDGIPVSANELMRYDPLVVRKLEVLADKYMVGRKPYDGILSFTTYKGNFESLRLGDKELLADDQGWQYRRKFLMPDYRKPETLQSRIPDFRSLLFWDPEVKTSSSNPSEISFFTGDVKGDFMIVVKGVSADGHLVHTTMPFSVK